MSRVGFIGLGQIGAPMARHLTEWPDGLVVCDVRPEATLPFAELGAKVVATPAEAAAFANVLSVMVFDDAQVREVVTEIFTTAAPGTVVAIHSTISPSTAEELAAEAPAGVSVIDAAVSGGPMGAHDGSLAILCGGDQMAIDQCEPVFAKFAKHVIRFGPVGAGTRAKLARNLITFVSYTAATEAQRLAEAAGIDLADLAKVVRHTDKVTGGAGSIMLRATTAPMRSDDEWHAILASTRDIGEKDLRLALDLGDQLGVDLPLTAAALANFGRGLGL